MASFEELFEEVPKGFEDHEVTARIFFENDGTWADVEPWEFWEKYEEAYAGIWDSELHFAEELAELLGYIEEIPEHLRCYFNYDAFATDIFIGDYWGHRVAFPNVYALAVFRNL